MNYSKNAAEAQKVVAQCKDAIAVQADVGDDADCRKLAEETFFLSRQLSDPAARRIIFRIAEAYDGLADRARVQSEQYNRRRDPRKASGG